MNVMPLHKKPYVEVELPLPIPSPRCYLKRAQADAVIAFVQKNFPQKPTTVDRFIKLLQQLADLEGIKAIEQTIGRTGEEYVRLVGHVAKMKNGKDTFSLCIRAKQSVFSHHGLLLVGYDSNKWLDNGKTFKNIDYLRTQPMLKLHEIQRIFSTLMTSIDRLVS